MDFTAIALQQAYKSINDPVYCRYCGKDIKQPSQESTHFENRWYNDWELENNAHEKCYQANHFKQGRRF